jgi:hypothetical protein
MDSTTGLRAKRPGRDARFRPDLWLFYLPHRLFAQAELYLTRAFADDPAAVADLSGFEKGQEVPPGTYRVDIYLNNGFMTTRDVTFNAAKTTTLALPDPRPAGQHGRQYRRHCRASAPWRPMPACR